MPDDVNAELKPDLDPDLDPDPKGAHGGEAPCMAALFEPLLFEPRAFVVAPLDELLIAARDDAATGGAIWSLPHDGELDANLVMLRGDETIGAHTNREVDVLLVVRSGDGTLTVDGETIPLTAGTLALVPRDRSRAIAAGRDGIGYLSIHRRRSGLRIGDAPGQRDQSSMR